MLLGDGLQREGEAGGQQASIGDLHPDSAEALDGRGLDRQAEGEADETRADESDRRQRHGQGSGAAQQADQEDMAAPEYGADDDQHVAEVERGEVAAVQIEDADQCQRGADVDDRVRRGADGDKRDQRHEQHVERGEEARIRHGGLHETILLQQRADEEHGAEQPDHHPAAGREVGQADLLAPQLGQREWQQHHPTQQEARAGKAQRPEMVHRRFLRDEGQPPDGGGDDEQQDGDGAGHGADVAAPLCAVERILVMGSIGPGDYFSSASSASISRVISSGVV